MDNNHDSLNESVWQERASGVLGRMFESCADDPVSSVHRAWGVSLIFVLLYFCLSIVESKSPVEEGAKRRFESMLVCSHLFFPIRG